MSKSLGQEDFREGRGKQTDNGTLWEVELIGLTTYVSTCKNDSKQSAGESWVSSFVQQDSSHVTHQVLSHGALTRLGHEDYAEFIFEIFSLECFKES